MKYPSTLILILPIYKYMGFDKAIRSYLGEKNSVLLKQTFLWYYVSNKVVHNGLVWAEALWTTVGGKNFPPYFLPGELHCQLSAFS